MRDGSNPESNRHLGELKIEQGCGLTANGPVIGYVGPHISYSCCNIYIIADCGILKTQSNCHMQYRYPRSA
jgi:hypothetical protein